MSRWPPHLELLRLSPVDPWTLEKAVSSVLIVGATRSGKTSGPFQYVIRSFLRAGFGGIFFCVKPQATSEYIAWAKAEHRDQDILLFGPNHPHRFNFLTYEANRYGTGKAIVENIIELLMDAEEVLGRNKGQSTGDSYFQKAMKQLLRNCLEVALAVMGEIKLDVILEIIQTLPQDMSDCENDQLLSLQMLRKAEEKAPPERQHELRLARNYFTSEWPRLADRTRTGVSSTLTVLLDSFLRYPLHLLFGQETTITPDDAIQKGKLIIVDIPIDELKDFAKVAAVLWKVSMQRALQSRSELKKSKAGEMRPIFLAGDECQHFVTSNDEKFTSTSAGANAISVYATQSVEALIVAMENNQSAVFNLLGNLQNRFVCRIDDPKTVTWLADTIGKVPVARAAETNTRTFGEGGFLSSFFGISNSVANTQNEQIDYDVQPRAFEVLKKGRAENDFEVEAIVICAGDSFLMSGKRWIKATFHQRSLPRLPFSTMVRITAPRIRG